MPGDTITLPVRDTLAALAVQDERRDGYTRDKFRHWTDARRDDCGTHAEVLVEEAVDPPTVGANCKLSGGIWYSHYDDQYLASARKADVDHLVPLAEAWESGASTWTPKEREAYANDLDDPRADLSISGLQPLEGQPEAAAVSGLPLQYTPPGSPTRPATGCPSMPTNMRRSPAVSAGVLTSPSPSAE
ncbi:HNH endonuclease [Streptomyces sp. NPDC001388]|uniref:HNH endonuclease n=1 Tax=Streptomyces sp. NPDC001388 TaxID=3364568 RepID=UPI0036804BAC